LNRRRFLKYAGATAAVIGGSALGLDYLLRPTLPTEHMLTSSTEAISTTSLLSTSSVTTTETSTTGGLPSLDLGANDLGGYVFHDYSGNGALDERVIRGRIRKGKLGHTLIVDRTIDSESARRAEEIVCKDERDRLRACGRGDLARRVRDVSKFSGYGYDIESFTKQGNKIRIEVKSFKSRKFRTIILTSSEWEAAPATAFPLPLAR